MLSLFYIAIDTTHTDAMQIALNMERLQDLPAPDCNSFTKLPPQLDSLHTDSPRKASSVPASWKQMSQSGRRQRNDPPRTALAHVASTGKEPKTNGTMKVSKVMSNDCKSIRRRWTGSQSTSKKAPALSSSTKNIQHQVCLADTSLAVHRYPVVLLYWIDSLCRAPCLHFNSSCAQLDELQAWDGNELRARVCQRLQTGKGLICLFILIWPHGQFNLQFIKYWPSGKPLLFVWFGAD